MAQQLEEVLRTRKTEVEELAERERIQYEARINSAFSQALHSRCSFLTQHMFAAQEEMIAELTSQLARVDSLTREGKTSTLHFLTREAADEERRGLETELAHLRAALRAKDQELEGKDAQIRDREETSMSNWLFFTMVLY